MMETRRASATAERAYQIWEGEGRPHGRDMDHWLQAESELAREGGPSKQARPTARKRMTAVASTPKPKSARAKAPRKTAGSTKPGPKKA